MTSSGPCLAAETAATSDSKRRRRGTATGVIALEINREMVTWIGISRSPGTGY